MHCHCFQANTRCLWVLAVVNPGVKLIIIGHEAFCLSASTAQAPRFRALFFHLVLASHNVSTKKVESDLASTSFHCAMRILVAIMTIFPSRFANLSSPGLDEGGGFADIELQPVGKTNCICFLFLQARQTNKNTTFDICSIDT